MTYVLRKPAKTFLENKEKAYISHLDIIVDYKAKFKHTYHMFWPEYVRNMEISQDLVIVRKDIEVWWEHKFISLLKKQSSAHKLLTVSPFLPWNS